MWITIPNEAIKDFRGQPIKSEKTDENLETVYKPIYCPGIGCEFETTNLSAIQDHITDEHDEETGKREISLRPVTAALDTAHLIMNLITRLSTSARENPLSAIRKSNDGFHASETWRRVWLGRDSGELRLKKEQYDWLHQAFDRKMPLTKEQKDAKEDGADVENETVGSFLYSFSKDAVKQALTTLPERRRADEEPMAEHVVGEVSENHQKAPVEAGV